MKAILALSSCFTLLLTSCGGNSTTLTGSRSETEPSASSAPAVQSRQLRARLIDELSVLTRGRSLTPAERGALARDPGDSVEAYIARFLDDASFARDVGPKILVHNWVLHDSINIANTTHGQYILQRFTADDGRVVHHLREPCPVARAEQVHPWWDPEHPILVCPDSHRPGRFVSPTTRWGCDGKNMAKHLGDERYCGCGPRLMRCYPDEVSAREHAHALVDEVSDTASHIIANDLDIRRLYTMNETRRRPHAELAYRRWRIESGEAGVEILDSLADWPREGKLARRHESAPGQHAGVLTTAVVAFIEVGNRAVMKNRFDKLWCTTPGGAHVATTAMLDLGGANARRGDGWEALAGAPVCETCHARLDHGMQFFAGFPDVRELGHFEARRQRTGMGALYHRDASDQRGRAPLNPQGFAQLATAQPEFVACLAKRVTDHVFQDAATSAHRDAVARAFSREPTLRSLMKTALALYASSYEHQADFRSGAETTDTAQPAALDAQLAAHCNHCHDESAGQDIPDFASGAISRQTAQAMLASVVARRMPKDEELSKAERDALIDALSAAIWRDPAERAHAALLFKEQNRSLPVHDVVRAFAAMRGRLGLSSPAPRWPVAERWLTPDLNQLTPGFAALSSLEALNTCRELGHDGEALDRCLEQATDPDAFVNGPAGGP